VSVTQQQVLDALAKVASPRGVPVTNANVLSAITVTDGKVFFSINVDAVEARAWESVRAQAEAAVRANSRRHRRDDCAHRRTQARCGAFAVTWRTGGTAAASPRPWRAAGVSTQAAAESGVADVETVGNSGCRGRDRGGLGEGRCRQIDHGTQSGARPARSGLTRRSARCRHLWPVSAAADRHSREAETRRQQENDSDRTLWAFHHVDRLSGRGRHRDDLARADGDVGDHPNAARRRLGHARHSRGRHAAGTATRN